MRKLILSFNPVCVGVFVAMIILSITLALKIDGFKQEAIELGFAQHNPTTGKWEWRENDNKE